MISEEEFQECKKEIDEIVKAHNQKIGMKEQIEETLRKDFKCKSVVQAKKLLKKKRQEKKDNEAIFDEAFKKFKIELRKYHKAMETGNK